jgi:hypothetical protein
MGPEIAVPLGAFATAIVLAVGVPLARAYSRRMDAQARNPQIPSEVAARLERMEQAIDSVALEVERISEGQRFTRSFSRREKARPARRVGRPRGIARRKCR